MIQGTSTISRLWIPMAWQPAKVDTSGHKWLNAQGRWYGKWEDVLYLNPQHDIESELVTTFCCTGSMCQGDGCSLSSKDGAVTREYFGRLAAGWLNILEMAVDDHCCAHWFNHRSISVDVIMCSSSIDNLAWASPLESTQYGSISLDHIHVFLAEGLVSWRGRTNAYKCL